MKKVQQDLIRANRQLEENKERLRSILNSSPYSIITTDLNGIITDCNPTAVKMHSYDSLEEIIGKNALNLVAEKSFQVASSDMQHVMEKGTLQSVEYTLVRKDGTKFPVCNCISDSFWE